MGHPNMYGFAKNPPPKFTGEVQTKRTEMEWLSGDDKPYYRLQSDPDPFQKNPPPDSLNRGRRKRTAQDLISPKHFA